MHHSYLFFSLLPPIFLLFSILSVCCSISSLSPPTSPSLSACLSPSFPHLVCTFTATTRLLSLPSISPITVSPFFFSCPSPFHLIHSPTLSPLLPPSLPLTVVTGRSLWLSHRPPVSILTAPFTCCSLFSFFCWFVL